MALANRVVAGIQTTVVAVHQIGVPLLRAGKLGASRMPSGIQSTGLHYLQPNPAATTITSSCSPPYSISGRRFQAPRLWCWTCAKLFSYVIQYPRWFGIKQPLRASCQPVTNGEMDGAGNTSLWPALISSLLGASG